MILEEAPAAEPVEAEPRTGESPGDRAPRGPIPLAALGQSRARPARGGRAPRRPPAARTPSSTSPTSPTRSPPPAAPSSTAPSPWAADREELLARSPPSPTASPSPASSAPGHRTASSPTSSPARAPSASAWARSSTRPTPSSARPSTRVCERARPAPRDARSRRSSSPRARRRAALLDDTDLRPARPLRDRGRPLRGARRARPEARPARRPLGRRDRRRPRRRRLSTSPTRRSWSPPAAPLMGALPEGGAMAAIEATEAEVAESIEGREAELSLAAVNGPTSTVISGAEEAVERDPRRVGGQGPKDQAPRRLPRLPLAADGADAGRVRRGRRSARLQRAADPDRLQPHRRDCSAPSRPPTPPTGSRHVREPVRFADAVATLRARAPATYLELGPDPVLWRDGARVPRRDEAEAAFVADPARGTRRRPTRSPPPSPPPTPPGARLDWDAFFAGTGAKRVPLPTYPFQRQRYWLASGTGAARRGAIGQSDAGHPLLGAAVEDPATARA